MWTVSAQCPERPEEGVGSTGVIMVVSHHMGGGN